MRRFNAAVASLGVMVAGLMGAAVTGCEGDTRATATAEPEKGAQGSAAKSQIQKQKERVEIIEAPDEDDTAGLARRELARAKADGRTLLVYVGATWCEPCERFHNAAKAGELDAALPGIRLLEFDLDRDRDRLQKAGYGSKMIPLFAIPREDGMGTGAQIEGGLKGDRAVPNLTTRLLRLLETGQPEP
ncbi:MAG TPA: thioredoxin [Polyangiaceae bacterium]|nr:thioredoxin [Polyangiaceae bacterium]